MKESYNNNQQQQQQQEPASGHENRDSNSSNSSATAVNAANNNHVLALQDIPEDDDEPPIRPFTTDHHYQQQQQKQEYKQYVQEAGNDSPRSSTSSTVISPNNLLSPTSIPSTRQSSFSTTNNVPFAGVDSSSLILKKRPFDRDPVDLAKYLHTSVVTGLSDQEAKQRLEKVGKNLLKGQEKVSIWNVLWRQVSNAMTVILLGALAIAFATQDFAEGGVIAGTYPFTQLRLSVLRYCVIFVCDISR